MGMTPLSAAFSLPFSLGFILYFLRGSLPLAGVNLRFFEGPYGEVSARTTYGRGKCSTDGVDADLLLLVLPTIALTRRRRAELSL